MGALTCELLSGYARTWPAGCTGPSLPSHAKQPTASLPARLPARSPACPLLSACSFSFCSPGEAGVCLQHAEGRCQRRAGGAPWQSLSPVWASLLVGKAILKCPMEAGALLPNHALKPETSERGLGEGRAPCYAWPRTRPAQGRGTQDRGVCFLNSALSCSPSRFPFRLLLSPGVSGGQAPVCAKPVTCLCAKLTGGGTTTRTLRMASRPLCWRPQSPGPGPCRPQPPPTPTRVALVPRSMPEPTRPLAQE